MANMKLVKATLNDKIYQDLQKELAKMQVKEMQDQKWYPEKILEIQTKIDFRYSEIKRNLENPDMGFMQKIQLKENTKLKTYTAFCNQAEKDKCFVACGSPDDMWIMVRFDSEIDFNAWIVSLAVS